MSSIFVASEYLKYVLKATVSCPDTYQLDLVEITPIFSCNRICAHVQEEKKPQGKTLTIVGAKRPCAWAQVCQLECCNKFAIDVVMETLNSIYSRDMEMWLIFWQALIESLASIHDIIPGMCGQCFELRRYVSWGKTPTCVLPRVILLQYPTTNCSVHFEVGRFCS